MKLALILVAVLVAIWLFKSGRRIDPPDDKGRKPTPGHRPGGADGKAPDLALEMVRCQHCDLHLPKAESIAGQRGVYCSEAHRKQAER